MASCLPDTDPNHLFQTMRACWKDASDQTFKAFFELFKQLMQADLARYTAQLALVQQVCDASRLEIRQEFSLAEQKDFDYLLLFRAIVYSHFSHALKDGGVIEILQNAQSSTSVGPKGKGHDVCIIVFAALLTMDGDCRGALLDLSLKAGIGPVDDGCLSALKAHLARLPGSGLP